MHLNLDFDLYYAPFKILNIEMKVSGIKSHPHEENNKIPDAIQVH